MRKAAHEGLSKSVVEFEAPQLNEAVLLAKCLLTQPAMWDNHLRRSTASMIMSIAYGTPPITSEIDPSIKTANDFVERLARAALPGAHLVEFFPWMMYIPSRCARERIYSEPIVTISQIRQMEARCRVLARERFGHV
jgi:hypothetical protein